MTVLFKLVPVGEDTAATLEVGVDEEGRYYVKTSNDEGLVEERTDWFGFRLDLALLRVAGLVREDVAYKTPLPATLAAVAVMAMVDRVPNGIGSGGTGAARQDALSGNQDLDTLVSTAADLNAMGALKPDEGGGDFLDAEEWRARGI